MHCRGRFHAGSLAVLPSHPKGAPLLHQRAVRLHGTTGNRATALGGRRVFTDRVGAACHEGRFSLQRAPSTSDTSAPPHLSPKGSQPCGPSQPCSSSVLLRARAVFQARLSRCSELLCLFCGFFFMILQSHSCVYAEISADKLLCCP